MTRGSDTDGGLLLVEVAGVVGAAGEVIKRKGYTNLAIGLTVAAIAECILRNEHR